MRSTPGADLGELLGGIAVVASLLRSAFENQYYRKRQGILDPATYAAYERSIRTRFLAFPGFRIWWELNRSVFSSAFVQHVDEMITTTPEASSDSLHLECQQRGRERARPS